MHGQRSAAVPCSRRGKTTYPHAHHHEDAGEDGQNKERIGNGEVGKPQGAAGLKRGDGKVSHALDQAEHANANGELE